MNREPLLRNRRAFLCNVGSGLGALTLAGTGAAPGQAGERDEGAPGPCSKRKNLLFFFTDEACPSAGAVIATLSWVAERAGVDFEAYVCIRPKTWAGEILAFTGHGHAEQFYYAANFYAKVLYCSLTDHPALQFKREVMAFGGDVIATRKPGELAEFYRDVLEHLGVGFPRDIVVVPSRAQDDKALWLQPYCYPDIRFREALGVDAAAGASVLRRLREAGAERASLLYCPRETPGAAESAGLAVEVVDSVRAGDTYGSVTCRIADRWIDRAKGVAFGDPHCTLRWMPFHLRECRLALYEPVEWRPFVGTVSRYARRTGNMLVYGSQTVKPMNDDVVTEFAREGIVLSLVGPDARIGLTIQSRHPLPVDWLREIPPPWEEECSDESLEKRAAKGGIPVCFLFYGSDIGHLPALSRVLDLMLVDGFCCGVAFPCTWYDFQPQLVEQLYVPPRHGGVFPKVEPLLVSAGRGVAAEAEGYLGAALLTASLQTARREIARHVGERLVPIGYYSFQDACPAYQHGTGEPQFGALEKADIRYCITYKHEQEFPQVVHQSDRLTALNQQTLHWYPAMEAISPLDRLKDWERRIPSHRRSGWIVLGFDLPFYGLCPSYLGGTKVDASMESVLRAMQYAASGGKVGRLFLAKPHEVVRYARILQELGKL